MSFQTPITIAEANNFPLTLKEIASWHDIPEIMEKPEVRASVPVLQRGLVWNPGQIELLWDSILRGFPIGVLVVCPRIAKQEREHDERVTHHLLDGQQRGNAIALGFTDPFPRQESGGAPSPGSILWLDLEPDFDLKSTRSYLVRVTTTAHPWGYKESDDAESLPIGRIRESLERIGLDPAAKNYKRPPAASLWPAAATTPVPLSWLLLAWNGAEDAIWDRLAGRAQAHAAPWAKEVCRFCANRSPAALKHKSRILRGIKRASECKLIVLNAPPELLEVSQQEKTSDPDTEEVTNIEQLFQRLNQQGTRLDGEELSYSMIKAHWPEMADPIDEIAEGRMPPARMVSIGVRAALARNRTGNLPPHPTVSAIRQIATGRDKTKQAIYKFIATRLKDACNLVDRWLKYYPKDNPNGLPPVLVTSIAIDSRDVYVLLLCFAARMIEDRLEERALRTWRKPMQALATVLHWFSEDKAKAANQVFQHCGSKPTIRTIQEALRAATREGHLHPIHPPNKLHTFLARDNGKDPLTFSAKRFMEWRWRKLIHRSGDDENNAVQEKWEGFLRTVFWEGELVLYAQRRFLAERFPAYDPARRDLWESHNRPWDFDHILASKYVFNRKDSAPFREVSSEWVSMNGNLRAWPFEDNRSDQDESAYDKIGNAADCDSSFLLANERDGFSLGDKVRRDNRAAQKFIRTCRGRLLRIYSEWYESMGVAALQKQRVRPGKTSRASK